MNVEAQILALVKVPLLIDLEDPSISWILFTMEDATISIVLIETTLTVSDTEGCVGMNTILSTSLNDLVVDLSTRNTCWAVDTISFGHGDWGINRIGEDRINGQGRTSRRSCYYKTS